MLAQGEGKKAFGKLAELAPRFPGASLFGGFGSLFSRFISLLQFLGNVPTVWRNSNDALTGI